MTRNSLFEVISDLLGPPSVVAVNAPFLSQVGFFPSKPSATTSVVATSGLSQIPLKQEGMQPLRQELIVVADDTIPRAEVVSLLCSVAQEVSQRGRAIQHGEVFGPAGPLFANSQLTALFATQPVFLPPTFSEHLTKAGITIGVWLVPISDAEAEFARRVGPDRFEQHLEGSGTSLYGFFRQPAETFA